MEDLTYDTDESIKLAPHNDDDEDNDDNDQNTPNIPRVEDTIFTAPSSGNKQRTSNLQQRKKSKTR